MQEASLYRYWEYYAATGQSLSWRGNSLKVISAGRLNEHEGPDYQGARFEMNSILFQGAVEMHVSLDEWYSHQHHHDPAYRNVQLHILLNEPVNDDTVNHMQQSDVIPTFVLPVPQPFLNKATQNKCQSTGKMEDASKTFQLLAINRLNYKVHSFRKKLDSFSAQQLFYQGYLRALGYPHNKHIFEWLASRITFEQINKYTKSPFQLLALYLGLAGFLNFEFKDPFARNLKATFSGLSPLLPVASILSKNWQFAAVRPLNHPQFRLAGWVALISSYQSNTLFDFFYSLIEQRLPYKSLLSNLNDFLTIKTDSYWKTHYALEKTVTHKKNQYYLGPHRIKEIIVNLLIPLHLAHAQQKGSFGLVSYLEDFYLSIPGSCSYKSIYRRKPWLKQYSSQWSAFTLGQAFIELEESYCNASKCDLCPLKRNPVYDMGK